MPKPKSSTELNQQAEKFFQQKNYQVAKNLFKKIPPHSRTNDITRKIHICIAELKIQKAKILAKRAVKFEKKNQLDTALSTFRESIQLYRLEWVEQRIAVLEQHQRHEKMRDSAKKAEQTGNTTQASLLYFEVFRADPTRENLLTCLINQVLDNDFDKASELLENNRDLIGSTESLSKVDLYGFGFVFARLGRFAACIDCWERIESSNEQFVSQKKTIRALWETELFRRFQNNPADVSIQNDLASLSRFRQSRTISEMQWYYEIYTAAETASQRNYGLAIEKLPLLPPVLSREYILLYAQLYHQAVKLHQSVSPLFYSLYMLSALAQLGCIPESPESAQDEPLIHDIARSFSPADFLEADGHAKCLFSLTVLTGILPESRKQELLLHPFVAFLMNKTGDIHEYINAKLTSQGNSPSVSLRIAATMYGPHTPLLFSLYTSQHDAETKHSSAEPGDEQSVFSLGFVSLVRALYSLKYSLHKDARENIVRAGQYLADHADFLVEALRPIIELKNGEIATLNTIERSTRILAEKTANLELQHLHARSVLAKFVKSYNGTLTKLWEFLPDVRAALNILPEHFYTKEIREIVVDVECGYVRALLEKSKLSRASDIAADSGHEEVREFFFGCVNDLVTQIVDLVSHGDDKDDIRIRSTVLPFFSACEKVNPNHPISHTLGNMVAVEQKTMSNSFTF